MTAQSPSFQLATILEHLSFKGLTQLDDAFENGTTVYQACEPEIIHSEHMAVSIPIIFEDVSVKAHHYNLKQHVVFWIGGTDPYIYTPTPTVKHKRIGRSLKVAESGDFLNIPINIDKFDVVAVRKGMTNDDNERILDVTITRFIRG